MKTIAIILGMFFIGYILYEYNERTCHWEEYTCWYKTPDNPPIPMWRPEEK